jgi:plastocyanin
MAPRRKLRVVVALGIIALAGCGSSAETGSASPSPSYSAPAVPAGAVMVTLDDFAITPATLPVKPGHVTFYVTNNGKTPHNFTIIDPGGRPLFNTATISYQHSAVLQADIAMPSYTFICTQSGHRALGMEGTLTTG